MILIRSLIGLTFIATGFYLMEVPGPVWLVAVGYWIYANQ